ncbi:hypothetical protein PGTUg99_029194 [Puccinia graminis f. sp. tritici]|uniref:Phosphatidylinositol-specific phospholipase C X domain-containing protein n=1 Tax=Puccinia graminis f. sp. tritici TaxID=56615 RepID=A0A5B0RGQ1_PUCGR|nr:hypothetical protein PGTUg99_029194 [Puccinia graminis f. sp. tritici]
MTVRCCCSPLPCLKVATLSHRKNKIKKSSRTTNSFKIQQTHPQKLSIQQQFHHSGSNNNLKQHSPPIKKNMSDQLPPGPPWHHPPHQNQPSGSHIIHIISSSSTLQEEEEEGADIRLSKSYPFCADPLIEKKKKKNEQQQSENAGEMMMSVLMTTIGARRVQWLCNWLGSLVLAAILILSLSRPLGRASPFLPPNTPSSTQQLNPDVRFQIGFQTHSSSSSSPASDPDLSSSTAPTNQIAPPLTSPPLVFSHDQTDEIARRIFNAAPVLGNYTPATQDYLEPVTGKLPPAIAFQCQDRSLFQMLGDGIRFFDLRVGFLPDHQQLGFYHASALLSTTATLPDVLLGFYKWLDEHPTETVLMSIKVDNATFGNPPSPGQPSSKTLQLMLYQLLTQSQLARDHWLQEDSKLGTLGAARGKLIFIQRIDWSEIRSRREDYTPIGIPLPPQQFNDNDPDFSILYNPVDRASAYVEDFYNILPNPSPILDKFNRKFDAVQSHLSLAAALNPKTVDQLFITFASGGALLNSPPVTPKMLAIGTGEGASLNNSVNGRIEALIQEQYSNGANDPNNNGQAPQRLGILIFDWYHQLPNLVQSVINQNPFSPPPSPSPSPSSPSSTDDYSNYGP